MANLYTVTAIDGQVVFTLPFVYSPGQNELFVFLNGQLQYVGTGYTESSSSTVTLADACDAGDVLTFRVPSVTFLALSGPTTFSFAPGISPPADAPTLLYVP